jgi:hypothetical protein
MFVFSYVATPVLEPQSMIPVLVVSVMRTSPLALLPKYT